MNVEPEATEGTEVTTLIQLSKVIDAVYDSVSSDWLPDYSGTTAESILADTVTEPVPPAAATESLLSAAVTESIFSAAVTKTISTSTTRTTTSTITVTGSDNPAKFWDQIRSKLPDNFTLAYPNPSKPWKEWKEWKQWKLEHQYKIRFSRPAFQLPHIRLDLGVVSVFVIGIVLALIILYSSQVLAWIKRRRSRTLRRFWKHFWQTNSWPRFWNLVEHHILGSATIPWGPWNAGTIAAHCGDKQVLTDLVRCGIIPLSIRPGGTVAYQVRKANFDLWNWQWPEYVHSNGRAYFDFVVPFPEGYVRNNPRDRENQVFRRFMTGLQNLERGGFQGLVNISKYNCVRTGNGYVAHNVPGFTNVSHFTSYHGPPIRQILLERGTRALLPVLHYFRRARDLVPGVGTGLLGLDHFMTNPMLSAPLLYYNPHAIVHIERWSGPEQPLEGIVHGLTLAAGAQYLYDVQVLATSLGDLRRDINGRTQEFVSWEQSGRPSPADGHDSGDDSPPPLLALGRRL